MYTVLVSQCWHSEIGDGFELRGRMELLEAPVECERVLHVRHEGRDWLMQRGKGEPALFAWVPRDLVQVEGLVPMDRRMPVEGDRYRHCQGNEYVIFRVIPEFLPRREIYEGVTFVLPTVDGTVGVAVACNIYAKETVIFYREEESGQVWARSLQDFMAVLSEGEVVTPDQDCTGKTLYYRFARIS